MRRMFNEPEILEQRNNFYDEKFLISSHSQRQLGNHLICREVKGGKEE